MSKEYKGYELIKAIEEGEIKEGSFFRIKLKDGYAKSFLVYRDGELKIDFGSCDVLTRFLLDSDYTYVLVEKEQDVDIQHIQELYMSMQQYEAVKIINKLIKAVKQLDKKMREKE